MSEFMKKAFTYICAVLFFTGCEKRDNLYLRTEVITIASSKAMVARHFSYRPYLMARYSDADGWTPYYDITGFEYEPGYEYALKVNVSMFKEDLGWDCVLRNGPPYRYELHEVTSKIKKESPGVPAGPMEHYREGDICLGGETLTVASEQVHDLTGSYFIVRRDGSAEWEVLPLPILGFGYESGHEYVIRVFAYAQKDAAHPYQAYKYLLARVESQEKKDSRNLPCR